MKNGCILCGGVGSGKSRTSLAYYLRKECGGSLKKALYIITTARKRDTCEWEKEFPHFLIQAEDVVIDSWNNIEKYVNVCGAFFIFDEQRVVGSGKWVKCFIQITKKNHWILLSATPGDTWMDYVPVFIANGFFKNREEFKREHVVSRYNGKFNQIIGYIGQGKLYKLREEILVDMDYDRPTTRHMIPINVGWDKSAIRFIQKERWDPYRNCPIKNVSEFCALYRKIINCDASRITKVKELVEEHPKVIIFYNFDYELDLLRQAFDREKYNVAEWNGHKHQPIPQAAKWVYLVQYGAGAEGWNCVETNTIIFYSQTYSYRILEQSCGRIDRMNTPYTDLYYYILKSFSPLDIRISRAIEEKKDFNERDFEW